MHGRVSLNFSLKLTFHFLIGGLAITLLQIFLFELRHRQPVSHLSFPLIFFSFCEIILVLKCSIISDSSSEL